MKPGPISTFDAMPLSADAEESVLTARLMAVRASHEYFGTGHLLLAILELKRGSAYRALRELCGGIHDLQEELDQQVRSSNIPEVLGAWTSSPQRTPTLLSLDFAVKYATRQKHRHLRTAHLLLGILHENGCWAARLLAKYGVTFESGRPVIESSLADE